MVDVAPASIELLTGTRCGLNSHYVITLLFHDTYNQMRNLYAIHGQDCRNHAFALSVVMTAAGFIR